MILETQVIRTITMGQNNFGVYKDGRDTDLG